MATTISTAAAEAMAAALNTQIGATATIRIYDGTPPANANASLSSNNVLATFSLSNPAFDSTTGGVMALDVTPALTVEASASGTASFFRILTAGTTAVLQGSVGAGSGELNLNTTTITSAVNVTITSGQVTVPTA